jgi:SlyX protein
MVRGRDPLPGLSALALAWIRSVIAMESPNPTERRLTELEIKLALAEDMLDQMNQTLFRQQQLIERLGREVADLRDQVPDGGQGAFRSLRDEIPPHY